MLAVEDYNAFEQSAFAQVGNDALWAFGPAAFSALGYPASVRHAAELVRFIDPMKEDLGRSLSQEDRFLRNHSLRTRFTRAESEMLTALRHRVAALSERWFGRRIMPINSLIGAVGLFRVIQALAQGRRLSILELGPGAGYLGALVIGSGHQYAAMENAQGFYLWQNRFFEDVAASDFTEWVSETRASRVMHVPWWKFVGYNGLFPIPIDIAICDHMLCEMNPLALRYSLRLVRSALSQSSIGALIFSGFGHPHNSQQDVENCLSVFGFAQVVKENVCAYSLKGHKPPQSLSSLERSIPLYQDNRERLLSAPEFMKLTSDELPYDYPFRKALGIWDNSKLFVSDQGN